VEFEWSPEKAEGHLKTHGVSFTEAATVFGDPLELTIPDPDHSEVEARFLSLSQLNESQVLVVAYTEREGKIRIIHARESNPKERRTYESDQNPAV
jgi:uncharacterized DUF497 family protein